jgi:hypothetical protein
MGCTSSTRQSGAVQRRQVPPQPRRHRNERWKTCCAPQLSPIGSDSSCPTAMPTPTLWPSWRSSRRLPNCFTLWPTPTPRGHVSSAKRQTRQTAIPSNIGLIHGPSQTPTPATPTPGAGHSANASVAPLRRPLQGVRRRRPRQDDIHLSFSLSGQAVRGVEGDLLRLAWQIATPHQTRRRD